MNKFEFISHVLENQKMNSLQKERFLKLASKEIGIVKPSNEELWIEIEKIKTQLTIQDKSKDVDTSLNPVGNDVRIEELDNYKKIDVKALDEQRTMDGVNKLKEKQIIPARVLKKIPEPNPKHVADFMSLFNQRKGLKYLTHDYDENSGFNIDEFLISAHKVFEKETKKLNIPQSLWRIVKQFAFDSKQTEWTSISKDYKASISLNIGWATEELRDWSKKNNLHPIRNEEYKKIINDFKRITRFESSDFQKLIEATLEKKEINKSEGFDIKKINLSKADFYSHVGFLKTAFETIFEEIKKHSGSENKKEITIKYERSISDDGYYVRKIIITHHNSFPEKELDLYLKEWQEKGNMGKIIQNLRGYCHWSVVTMIENAPTKVNILRDELTPEYKIIKCETEELPKGFTHLLTFFYK